jgi:nucleoside-diphosphate kinase
LKGDLPEILSLLLNCKAFSVTALEWFQMEKPNAAEFYEVYQTVIPEYPTMVDELCNGPVMAVELTGAESEGDVVSVYFFFLF